MRSSELMELSGRTGEISSAKTDNFLPPIKDKIHANELDRKPASTCREAVKREFFRNDVTSARRESRRDVTPARRESRRDVTPARRESRRDVTPARRESLFHDDTAARSIGNSRSLSLSPRKLPDIDRSKCSSVGSILSMTSSSRNSRPPSLASNRLSLCKSPSFSQFESWVDLDDDVIDTDDDVITGLHTFPQTSRLQPVLEDIKLPDIVGHREICQHEDLDRSRLEDISGPRTDTQMHVRSENEHYLPVSPRTHGNTLLPIKTYGVRKKKQTRKEASKFRRLGSSTTTDQSSLDDNTGYKPFQRSKLATRSGIAEHARQRNAKGSLGAATDVTTRNRLVQPSTSSTDDDISSTTRNNPVDHGTRRTDVQTDDTVKQR